MDVQRANDLEYKKLVQQVSDEKRKAEIEKNELKLTNKDLVYKEKEAYKLHKHKNNNLLEAKKKDVLQSISMIKEQMEVTK